MRALWVTQAKISLKDNNESSGGWTIGALRGLVSCDDMEIHYAFLSESSTDYEEGKVHFWGIHLLDGLKYPKKTEDDIYELLLKIKPDVIHCWGTETPVTIAAVRAAERCNMLERVVVNVQGMLLFLEKVFEQTSIPGLRLPIVRPIELFTKNSVFLNLYSYKKIAIFEMEVLKKVKHFIGRTPVDRAFVQQYAPTAEYHFCNETLRERFYEEYGWRVDSMRRHSIFMSDGHYPIKSLEKMFDAMAILANKYDDVELYIAGQDMFCERKLGKKLWDAVPAWIKRDGYQQFLYKKAIKLGIKNKVHFVGRQDSDGMKKYYLQANVYVNSSIIENESNSLSEAKILGVPCVASYVGGVVSRIKDGEDGFYYPWNEPWQLADRIMQIFDDDELAKKFSENSQKAMASIVDGYINLERMINIYNKIIE